VEKTVHTLEEFNVEAADFARALRPRAEGATLVTLSGELGAGKTAFTKAVASTFGVAEMVTSPTFVLEKIYDLSGQAFSKLIHIDAYRLNESAEAAPLKLEELMRDPQNLVLVEWPERIREALPPSTVSIAIVAHEDGTRTITYG
jgi:tRNA threonylcarbamoyladenosine biosynthesis protein TsaE